VSKRKKEGEERGEELLYGNRSLQQHSPRQFKESQGGRSNPYYREEEREKKRRSCV